jgi:hypothetical protein
MHNGAGKSTTIRMILGLAPADCGCRKPHPCWLEPLCGRGRCCGLCCAKTRAWALTWRSAPARPLCGIR